MNKSDLIAKVTERLGGDRTTATAAVNGVLEEIEGSVARGERVSLTGFGTFDRRERAPRSARNPRTGETIQLGASVVPVFRPGTGFRTVVTRADGVSGPGASAAAGNGVVEAGVPDVEAEAPAAGEKAGKKGRDRAAEKPAKGAKKSANGKSGKKAAKASR